MTKAELERVQNILTAKRAELSGPLFNRDEIAIQKAADALDEVQFATQRELALRNPDRKSNMLWLIGDALARVDNGTYGICLHCEEAISSKRLHALPWAAFCITCQETADKNENRVRDAIIDLFANAA